MKLKVNCFFSIDVNGKKKAFGTESDLDQYLTDNLNNDIIKESDVVFYGGYDTSSNRVALKALISNSDKKLKGHRVELVYDAGLNEYIEKEVNGYKSVSKFINDLYYDGIQINPVFVLENYKKNRIKQETEKGKSESQVISEIEQDEAKWSSEARTGTKFHAVAEVIFQGKDNYEDAKSVYEQQNRGKNAELTLEEYEKSKIIANQIKDRIKELKGDDVEFITELRITDDEQMIVGRFDLVTIDKDGNLDVWDFKTSTKEVENWDTAKIRSVSSQLAVYRAILAHNGIEVRNSSLNVLPVIIYGHDVENDSFSSLKFNEEINFTLKYNSDLNYEYGKISKSVHSLISENLPEINQTPTNIFEKINTENITLFGSVTGITVDSFTKNDKYVLKSDNPKFQYMFYDYVSAAKKNKNIFSEKIYCKDDEDLKLKVGEYLLKKKEYELKDRPRNLFDIFSILMTTKVSSFSKIKENIENGLHGSNASDIASKIASTFSQYITSGHYDLIENDDLINLGIFAFKHKSTNVVNFVSLTNNNLNEYLDLNIPNAKTILGNKLSDYEVSTKRKYKDILPSIHKNQKMLEVFTAINSMKNNIPNLKIGRIQVVNITTGQKAFEKTSRLKHNFDLLCKEYNIQNNISDDDVQSLEDNIICMFDDIINMDNLKRDNINKLFAKYNEESNTQRKIKHLLDIKKIIEKNYDVDKKGQKDKFNFQYEILYHTINVLIAELSDVNVNVYNPTKNLSVNLLNPNEDLGIGGNMVSTPAEIRDSVISKVTEMTSKTYERINQLFTIAFKMKTIDKYVEFFKNSGVSDYKRMTVGSSLKAFDPLIERNPDGKLSETFRVKNPFDKNNDLQDFQRAYLKEFLFNINRYRLNMLDDSVSSFYTSDKVIQAISNGSFFDIPLMRGDAISQFKNKKFTAYMKDWYTKQFEFYNITSESKERIRANLNNASYQNEMINQFDSSGANRMDDLSKYGPEYFQTNLEIVESQYVFASIKKQEFDRVLPIMNAIKTAYNFVSVTGNTNIDHINTFYDKYVKTRIFNESGLSPEEEGIMKVANKIISYVSLSKLGLNPNGLVREPVMGLFTMMSRAMTRTFGKDAPGVKDIAKAYTIFSMESKDTFGDSMGLLEGLSATYRATLVDSTTMMSAFNVSNKGLYKIEDKALYYGSTASDFMNRNIFLVAKMIKDGCFEAHYMKDNILMYDWKKDDRIKQFALGNKNHQDYHKHKDTYTALYQEFINEGFKIKFGDELPRAYSQKIADSIKSDADSLFGYFDKEKQMMAKNTLIGKFLLQFKTHLASTKERYASKGYVNTVKGEWVHAHNEKGEPLYIQYKTDEDGNEYFNIGTEVTDSPYERFEGRFTEGMINSFIKTLEASVYQRFIKGNKDFELEYRDVRVANTKQFTLNTGFQMLVFLLTNMMLGDDDEEIRKSFLFKNAYRGIMDDSLVSILDANFNINSATLDELSRIWTFSCRTFNEADPTIAMKGFAGGFTSYNLIKRVFSE